MFSLKDNLLKMLGLGTKDNETDVEAFDRIKEKLTADQLATTEKFEAAEKQLNDAVVSVDTKLAEMESKLSGMFAGLITASEEKQKLELDNLKIGFAKDLTNVKTKPAPVTSEGEVEKTDEEGDTPGKKVAAWKKPIVNVRQSN